MKHSLKITLILLAMFFITQMIGLFVITQYSPHVVQDVNAQGEAVNVTLHDLPYGMEPPQGVTPQSTIVSIILALIFAVAIMFIFMRYKVEMLFRLWFFVVVALALGISINAIIKSIPYSSAIALVVALPLAFFKVFQRNLLTHNLTELLIYPGIAAIFVPLLNLKYAIALLVIISLYDMYAVWHAGFMQKMAKYQIQKLKLFTGFFVPYVGKKEKAAVHTAKSKKKEAKVKVHVAILGGGDVVFPIILAGVVLRAMGLTQAIMVSIGATLALALLFYYSEKGKFYPAMPFISAGCFVGLVAAYLI